MPASAPDPGRCRRRDLRAHGLACRGVQHRKAAARPLRRKGIERAVRDAPDLRDMGENLHALCCQQLQAQAETLSDLLQIEDSLTEVQSQIESWQSQLDWYSDQVQQCTVYIDLNEVQTYTPADEGFFSRIGTALVSGWGNFVNGLQQFVVALASVWPLAVLACAAVAVALAWRKKHPKK